MLWTDAQFVQKSDLLNIDWEVTSVAQTNGNVSLDTIIQQTINECGIDMYVKMQRFGGFLSSGLVSANHLAAVFNVGGPGVNRARVILGQIVVDDTKVTTVKNWVAYSALRYLYRDAYARVKGDRYKLRMEQLQQDLDRRYMPAMTSIGLPVVYRPLACPGAILETSGSWGSGNVSSVVAAGATGGPFFVTCTYVDQSQYLGPNSGVGPTSANNAESYIAALQSITVPTGHAISVNISSLIPPNGQVDQAQLALAIVTPYNATGWNLYVGSSATGPFYLQNVTPIPISQKTYSLTADPVLSGHVPNPQYVDAYYTFQNTIQRG